MFDATDPTDQRTFLEVHNLYARWSLALDSGHPQLLIDDFASDGLLWVGDRGHYRGHDELRAIFNARAGATLHVITNVYVEHVEEERARSHAYFQFFDMATGAPAGRGVYDDELVRENGQLRWKVKAISYLWRSPAYAAGAAALRRSNYGEMTNPVGGIA